MRTLHTIYTSFAKRVAVVLTFLMTIGIGNMLAEQYTYVFSTTDNWYTTSNKTTKVGTGSSNNYTAIYYSDNTEWTASGTSHYFNSGYYLLGKSGACLNVPTFNDEKITSIQIFNSSGCSKNVSVAIISGNQTAANAQTWSTQSSNYTYSISSNYQSSSLAIKVSNGYNAQITKVIINTESVAPACSYIVTFNSNYGTNVTSSQEFRCDETKALTANSFSRTGYTFAGWSTTSNGSVVYNDGQSVTNLTSNGNTITLYAKWTPNKYTVNFTASPNGYGTVSQSSIANVPYGTTVTSNSNEITINGTTVTANPAEKDANYSYSFKNWSNVPNTITGTCTITANFTRTERELTNYRTTCQSCETVTIKKSSESPESSWFSLSINKESVQSPIDNCALEDLAITIVAGDGYKVESVTNTPPDDITVSINPNGTSADVSYPKHNTIVSEVTLAPREYTITYHLNGGSGVENRTYTIESEDITLPTPTHEKGLTFAGWYQYEDFTEDPVTIIIKGSTGNKEFWAKWEKATPTFAWSADSYTAALEADNTFPTVSNPNSLSVTYTSSDENVAKIDANGNIVLGSEGRTTITAIGAESATHKSATDTYELIVVAANCKWIETDIANINSGDEVVITMCKDEFTWTISNTKNTSTAPTANDITANIQGNYLTTVSDEYKWVIKKDNANLTFYSYSNNANYLYCINGDDGVRVGTGTAKVFVVDGNYLKNTQTTDPRYVGISFNTDPYSWRCYTGTTGVIKSQTLKFYKRECLDATNYWVTWDAGDGAWEDKSSKKIESYTVGATITKPENPTREGYRFDGWTPTPGTMPAENKTFTAKWTEVYTISWYENGVPSYTYVPSDNAVVTWEDNIADCGEKKFYGWTADDTFVSDPTTPPTLISKGTTIAGDVTYYAVYADAEEPANPGYTKVTTISEGIYLIAAPSKNIAYKAVTSDVPAVISNNVISSLPEGATELLVELGTNTNAGYFAISYNNNGTKTYIYGADKSLSTTNTATYDWSLDADNATLGEIQSKSKPRYYIQANNTNGDFKAYAHTQTVAYLYKKQTTTYKNFAVSCATYKISVTTSTGGTVTTTPADEAGAGQEITINVTPDDCKYLTALKYNDGSDYSINIFSTPYKFTMPAADVTVTATFADKTATDIEILTSAHRMLMQGSAFVGEQVRITYNNGDKETLSWNDSRLTFTGHNTATLGSQTVTVTYNDCGTQSASYNIEVIDGLGITFWDDDYTETIKYEPGDLVDVDNKIGQNICSGWEFAGWSETKVANKSNGFTPVHNFNATEAKVLYAVYMQISTDWISAYNIDELHPGAKYVIVAHYGDSKEYALTNTNNTNSSYLDGANLTTDCEQVREGDAYPYKDRYKLKVTPDENWKWQLENTGSGWTMRNIKANKYLKVNSDKTISLTATPDDKFTLSNGYNDSEITAKSSSNNYLSWYNSSKYWNGHTSGQQYYLTNETNFTSTPPCSPLSATFHGNGGIVTDGVNSGDNLTLTEPTRDAGITTPTANFADCNGKTWTFVGWSRKEIDVTRVPVLTTDLLHDGGGNEYYNIQEDGEEFWAVYTNQGTPETKYGTITFTDADVTREYADAKTITKSVTAMGDYDFELYHVSNASSKGIQFDHEVATRGYIKNITSLGKINSISLNDFQTGDIDDVKVYVGNMPNAINTLLTEADLQQIGNTYTYYPQNNYAYVKIEANGYCGITYISIDFGKGTQIWATTPDCSTITLSGDELYVTSTNGQSIRAAERLTVKAVQLESKAKVVISSNSSDIYFSDVLDANFTQAVKPTETLTLPTDVDGNLAATEIYVHYRPSVDGTGIPEDVVVSANLETPNPSITDDHTIHVRNLPADFVIAAKWGDNWYAMPANMDSQSSTEGWLIEVDDAANPTKALAAPNTTKYGLKSVYTSNSTDDRFENYGERLVFVENVTTPVANKTLYNGGDASSSKTNIQVYAQYANYYKENPNRYEWIPTTTDMIDYTLTSGEILTGDAVGRTVSLDNHGIFGTLLQDKSYNGMVRLLPVDNFYAPAELQVVEWKQNSVSVMYTGAGSKATTKVGSNKESDVQLLSDKKIDHAVYSLATTDLTAATNQPLVITIKDDAEATISAIKLTIPAIVATNKSSTELGVAEANAKATSIVVLDGATLTASNTKYTYDDVVVYPGGKLVIGNSGKLGMYTLTLRLGSSWGTAEYEYKYPQFVLNTTTDGAYSNTSGQINLDYVTTKDQYYTFVAPFEVKTKDIKYPIDIYGTNVAINNSGSFQFEYYDGAARAAGNTGWTTVAEDPTNGATLTPGQGYTFLGMPKKVSVNGATSTRQKYGIHRIPMKVAASVAQTHETTDQAVPLAVTLAEKDNDSGWNIVGNPYMSEVTGLTNDDIQVGELVHTNNANGNWTGKWHWDNPTTGQRFLVMPSNDGRSYTSVQVSNATLHAFKHFFVQIQNASATAMSIPVNNRVDKNLAPARYAQAEIEKDIEIAVQMIGDKLNDQMDFLINDIYSTAFEKNADFTKMMNATNFNIYGVHVDNNLSFVALDKAAAVQSVAIGFQVPKAGEYQLSLSDKPYVMADKIEALFVTDHEASPEVTTNLVDEDYTFYVNQAQTNNTRFTVSIILKPDTENTPTGVDNINTKANQPIKFLYQDKIYILRNGMIYDTTGKQVITINK